MTDPITVISAATAADEAGATGSSDTADSVARTGRASILGPSRSANRGRGRGILQAGHVCTAGITIRAVVGSLLILLGLMQLNLLPVSFLAVEDAAKPLLARQARLRRDRPALAFGLFGFGYLLAGFG
jgi:hypothetical protein